IPTDGRPGENTRIHARQTRLNLDVHSAAACDDVRLFIESDFFGSGDSLRLRHAFFESGGFLAGQTWSTFMDESILPNTLDFESPRSVILDRRGLLRLTVPATERLEFAIAVEDPQGLFDQDSAPPGGVEQLAPDLVTRTRYETTWGHLQAAGLVRLLRFRADSGDSDDAVGWGFNFTGRVNRTDSDGLLFQVAFGEGIESYRQGADAAVNAAGDLEVLPVTAWIVGYEVDWTERASSTLVYSAANVDNAPFQAPTAGNEFEYLAANVIFRPRPRFSWGIEYLFGSRTDFDNARGEAHRMQVSFRYDLP
ncbi:MAG: DcaP family trimeric outer membrane transporter, partial [Aeoliella sp.]